MRIGDNTRNTKAPKHPPLPKLDITNLFHLEMLICLFDYQPNRHCAKTFGREVMTMTVFDYQPNRHCAKTSSALALVVLLFDYQPNRHCAKTWPH